MKPAAVKFDKQGAPILPRKLPEVIDLLYLAEQERFKIQHAVERLKKIESACEAKLIDDIDLTEKKGDSGTLARIEIEQVRVPTAKDWDKIWAWAKKNDVPEIFHKRLSTKVVEDRWENKQTIPGVEGLTVKKVHIHKLKGAK